MKQHELAIARGTRKRRGPFARIEDAIDEFRAGRMIIVVDDEDRENEGDLTIAADKVTPEAINFMARYGRGLICLSMTPERLDELEVPLMVAAEQLAVRDRLLCVDRGEEADEHRHFRDGPRRHGARGHRSGDPSGRPGASRTYVPACDREPAA